MREEAEDAKLRGVLVPARIDNIQPPIGFRGIQTADLVNWNAAEPTPAFDRLTAAIAALIGSSANETRAQVRPVDADVKRKTRKANSKPQTYRLPPPPSAILETLKLPAPDIKPGYFVGVCSALSPAILWFISVAYRDWDKQIESETITMWALYSLTCAIFGVISTKIWLQSQEPVALTLVASFVLFLLLTIALHVISGKSENITTGPTLNITAAATFLTVIPAVLCNLSILVYKVRSQR